MIQTPEFYIRLIHPLFETGHSSITFGPWSDGNIRQDQWTTLPIPHPSSGWLVELDSICMTTWENVDGQRNLTWTSPVVTVGRPVLFDTGTVQTYLPKANVDSIRDIMITLGATDGEVLPARLPEGLHVHFRFRDRLNRYVQITGQGERFLRTHWTARGPTRRVLPIAPGPARMGVLGSNFFYTFIVGHFDGDEPSMKFAPQPWMPLAPGSVLDEDRRLPSRG
ncbi:hypothetical protein EXIGLDRAFT_77348 [Exidia glandulosa HHB12029]|uniref:Peptidase A1 domain-containing protein n=1 Tax=Exidia glandulosa HHB12029 TaxID=1314781 RepID=A0A165NX84_EXIGL|nr:hypothetical protein EXIGLDRAFT_77348 [Exidia glandulosa HHB12029]